MNARSSPHTDPHSDSVCVKRRTSLLCRQITAAPDLLVADPWSPAAPNADLITGEDGPDRKDPGAGFAVPKDAPEATGWMREGNE
jgi:hypothetical protein